MKLFRGWIAGGLITVYMKTRRLPLSCLALFGVATFARGQGTFQNLNFESANVAGYPPGASVPITVALPAWTGYLNGNPVTQVFYNNQFIGGPSVSLTDSLAPTPAWAPIQGSYSVYLFAGAGIGQTGQLPNDAAALLFLLSPGSSLNVSFQGRDISTVQLGTSGNNFIMAGNISMFAGQTGELLFAGGGLFDAIQFSSQPIPEPGTFGLVGIGALLVAWRLYRGGSF